MTKTLKRPRHEIRHAQDNGPTPERAADVWDVSGGGANDIAILKARYHRRTNEPIMDVHLVPRKNAASALRNRMECFSCHRMLPENQFSIIDNYYRRSVNYLVVSGHCRRCRTQRRNGADLSVLPPKLVTWLDKLHSGARASWSRGLLCGIDKEDVYNLWIQQSGKCALTGMPMEYSSLGKNPLGASIDRIDSGQNYTPDNIHLVCWVVNQMKNNMTMEQFMLWIHRLANHDDVRRKEA